MGAYCIVVRQFIWCERVISLSICDGALWGSFYPSMGTLLGRWIPAHQQGRYPSRYWISLGDAYLRRSTSISNVRLAHDNAPGPTCLLYGRMVRICHERPAMIV